MQLTLEQRGYKTHRFTYTQIFFSSNTTVLHSPLVESTDIEEPQIWRLHVSTD